MKRYLALFGLLACLLAGHALADAPDGWYWNQREGGTGFMFEGQAHVAFVAFFVFDDSGKPVWYVATGPLVRTLGTATFQGTLLQYRNGQPADSTVYRTPTASTVSSVRIDFDANDTATVYLPTRTLKATRFNFSGSSKGPSNVQPETGWYWNPQEGGRGYAIEVQDNKVFMAMFHYAKDGSPTWNIAQGDLSSGSLRANFETYSNGQTLTGTYRLPAQVNDGTQFDIAFNDPCLGIVHRSDMPATSIQRFSFAGMPAGAECRARNTPNAIGLPGTYRGYYSGQDSGSFTLVLDSYGRVNGTMQSSRTGGTWSTSGTSLPDGKLNLTTTLGPAGTASFNGTIRLMNNCTLVGTWTSAGGRGGTFSGGKDGGSCY
ncbi:hypothetical protein SAMN02745857_03084 [Andreprevotia lacus DSM 23236]|jgi:hypothetical protein|uniref:Uncharacterized protein n=1 Tax=Andreprevotia lacus DSM 23236 TaxID=1121001 RepID=A0A1W1XWZ0_9NEIS|nr:hypothetical protein [Andreprevotia lacus]SMC28051.1 hypothetical protein SAMN02745857_03084 [Andreprevotia lacus DSM 23236]